MRTGLSFALLALLSTSAHAETDLEAARRHFGSGAVLYDEGRYAEAIGEFEAANSLAPSPRLDYNVAKALDRLGRWSAAVERYERYLVGYPAAPDAAEVRGRVDDLRGRSPLLQLAPAAVVAPVSTRLTLRRTALGLAILDVALLSVGAGLVGTAHADYGHLTCAPNCAESAYSGVRSMEYAGAALLGAAGAVLVADVALWIASRRYR